MDFDIRNFDVSSMFNSKPQKAGASTAVDVRAFDPKSIGSDKSDLQQVVGSAARRHGVPEDLLHNIAQAESSYEAGVKNKTGSSAKGLFQFVDSTWKRMGGKPGEQTDPYKNAELGAQYTSDNIGSLRKSLGRDPTYGEVYAAHHFGSGVSKMIANSRENESIERGLAQFNSPSQVRKIMAQNPSLRGKTVGDVMGNLHQKAGTKYVPSPKRADAEDVVESPMQVAQGGDDYQDAWLEDETGRQELA